MKLILVGKVKTEIRKRAKRAVAFCSLVKERVRNRDDDARNNQRDNVIVSTKDK